jgi:hypothetical protein
MYIQSRSHSLIRSEELTVLKSQNQMLYKTPHCLKGTNSTMGKMELQKWIFELRKYYRVTLGKFKVQLEVMK